MNSNFPIRVYKYRRKNQMNTNKLTILLYDKERNLIKMLVFSTYKSSFSFLSNHLPRLVFKAILLVHYAYD